MRASERYVSIGLVAAIILRITNTKNPSHRDINKNAEYQVESSFTLRIKY